MTSSRTVSKRREPAAPGRSYRSVRSTASMRARTLRLALGAHCLRGDVPLRGAGCNCRWCRISRRRWKCQHPNYQLTINFYKIDNSAAKRHWDDLRHRTPPAELSPEEWWLTVKARRDRNRRVTPLTDRNGLRFSFTLPDRVLEQLHAIGRQRPYRARCRLRHRARRSAATGRTEVARSAHPRSADGIPAGTPIAASARCAVAPCRPFPRQRLPSQSAAPQNAPGNSAFWHCSARNSRQRAYCASLSAE